MHGKENQEEPAQQEQNRERRYDDQFLPHKLLVRYPASIRKLLVGTLGAKGDQTAKSRLKFEQHSISIHLSLTV